jgi:uroporphyrinogen-III synthase
VKYSGATSLHGARVLVTRPIAQARTLALAIEAHGGEALVLPTIEIRPIELSIESAENLRQLAQCDAAIFISANAVRHGLAHVSPWPAHLPALAVGETTARALREAGIPHVVTPVDGADSEALLRLPQLQTVRDRRVVIFRGQGGREVLATTLRSRGARVDYIECYHRALPQVDPLPIQKQLTAGGIDASSVSSAHALDNLFTLLGDAGESHLRDTPTFVPHARIAQHARERGMRQIIVTAPGDPALIEAMCHYFSAHAKARNQLKLN